jgi:hypothetical protein
MGHGPMQIQDPHFRESILFCFKTIVWALWVSLHLFNESRIKNWLTAQQCCCF